MVQVEFGKRANEGRAFAVSRESCINAYVKIEPNGKNSTSVYRAPGIDTFLTLPTGPVRGGVEMGGDTYIVSGSRIYRVQPDLTVTDLGAIPGAGPVPIAQNGSQVCIVAESKGYIATAASLVQITDADFRTPSFVVSLDGYFIFIEEDTDIMFHSELNNGLAYDPLDVFTAEGKTDILIGLFVDKSELWAFGSQTTQVFVDTGGIPAFTPISTTYIDRGLQAPFSTAAADNTIFFVGNDGIVYRINGYQTVRVSTDSVEYQISQLNRLQKRDMDATVYTIEGRPNYVITSDNWTLAFDVASGEWHQRRSTLYDNWRAIALDRNMVSFFGDAEQEGIWLVGDRTSGRVGQLKGASRTEFGEMIIISILGQIIHDFPRPLDADSLHVDFQMGVGLETGQGSDPQVMFRFTDDLGQSWTPEIWMPLGKTGQTFTRVTLNRQGQIPETGRIYETSYSEPTEFVLIGADLQATPDEING